ncbi:hypothetical protein ACFFQF_33545 [Haladaptatus pallidirubidus]|uniref:hypothetical protein n=1 Tax=Haladaptatus pallidirubidus TaxID=1008152 RepID=UPI001D1002B3|nr:hypothetical protein [Haladaptatus pallidirubidus]
MNDRRTDTTLVLGAGDDTALGGRSDCLSQQRQVWRLADLLVKLALDGENNLMSCGWTRTSS